jgi:anti-sigma factor RsiW
VSGRKRKPKPKPRTKRSRRPRWWLWILGAAVGAVAAYFLVPHRGSGSAAIPLPGEAAERQGVEPPHEEIHDVEREALDRVLRERSH